MEPKEQKSREIVPFDEAEAITQGLESSRSATIFLTRASELLDLPSANGFRKELAILRDELNPPVYKEGTGWVEDVTMNQRGRGLYDGAAFALGIYFCLQRRGYALRFIEPFNEIASTNLHEKLPDANDETQLALTKLNAGRKIYSYNEREIYTTKYNRQEQPAAELIYMISGYVDEASETQDLHPEYVDCLRAGAGYMTMMLYHAQEAEQAARLLEYDGFEYMSEEERSEEIAMLNELYYSS